VRALTASDDSGRLETTTGHATERGARPHRRLVTAWNEAAKTPTIGPRTGRYTGVP
jgi:hypothetical protein